MKNIAIAILMCCGAMGAGCRVIQSATHQSHTVTTDSTSTVVTERLVPVYLPGDTVVFVQQMECPDNITPTGLPVTPTPFKKSVQGKRSQANIEVDKLGRLRAIFNCDQWQDSVKVRDTEINRLKQIAYSDSTIVTVYQKIIPPIYKYSMGFTCGILLLILAWIGWNGVKLFYKF